MYGILKCIKSKENQYEEIKFILVTVIVRLCLFFWANVRVFV